MIKTAPNRYIAECIGIRAATLAAAGVASLLNKMNRRWHLKKGTLEEIFIDFV